MDAMKRGAGLFLGTLMLSGVAIYNGFPLVYPDTGLYIVPFAPTFRTPFYSLVTSVLHQGWSLWPVVFVQSLIVAHLVGLVARVVFGIRSATRRILLIASLTLLSSLPWFTGQILPDVYAGVLIPSLFLLAFGHGRLSGGERIYLAVLSYASFLFHGTHVFLGLGLVGIIGGLVWLRQRSSLRLSSLAWLAAPVALGIPTVIGTNLKIHGEPSLSLDGASFYLCGSIVDGPALDYLERSCPERRYALCEHLAELETYSRPGVRTDPSRDRLVTPRGELLWNLDSPFRKAGWFPGLRDEAREVVASSMLADPWSHVRVGWRNSFRQFFALSTGSHNVSYLKEEHPTEFIRMVVPGSFSAYAGSRQSRNQLFEPVLARIHFIAFLLSLGLSPLLVIFLAKRGLKLPGYYLSAILAGLVLNAVLCGAISGVFDRYQARVAWLIVCCAIASSLALAARDPAAREHQPGPRDEQGRLAPPLR